MEDKYFQSKTIKFKVLIALELMLYSLLVITTKDFRYKVATKFKLLEAPEIMVNGRSEITTKDYLFKMLAFKIAHNSTKIDKV